MPVLGAELRVLDVIGYTPRTIAASPPLSLARAGTSVVLSWPINFAGFTLKSATNPASSVTWSNVSPPPSIVNGQYTVTNSVSGSRKFYRLMK